MSPSPLEAMGYTMKVVNNGTNVVTTNASWAVEIAADAIFADRNRMLMRCNFHNYSWMAQALKPTDTRGYQKFVIGCVAESMLSTAGEIVQVILSGPASITSSNAPPTDFFIAVNVPNDGSKASYVYPGQATPVPIDNITEAKPFHIEVFVEEDVDRARVYIDGTLVADYSYTGTFASQNGGFSMVARLPYPTTNTMVGVYFSNVYFLGVDSVHTGILGPAARVLEVAPASDMDVSWKRPDGYATNAEVMGQMFNQSSPAYLAAGSVGDYDVYGAPNAVAANAVQIFGAGVKVNAMTMAGGTHTLRAVVKTPTAGVTEVGPETTLQLGALKPSFSDISTNPDTGAVWTPSAVTAAGFGMKLKS